MTIKSTLQLIPGAPKAPKSVDQILSVFTATVNELKATQEHQFTVAAREEAAAADATARANSAKNEANRAAQAISKIESFLA